MNPSPKARNARDVSSSLASGEVPRGRSAIRGIYLIPGPAVSAHRHSAMVGFGQPRRGIMIDCYTWPTPNGHKVHIMLEETGLKYNVHGVNIRTGEQFRPDFLKVSPNNRIPAIVDSEGPGGKPVSVFETGAILIYLGEKTGKFRPRDGAARYDVIQWVMWQMGGLGPMMGQANHFRRYSKEKLTYAIERYTNEANRLTGVLDKELAKKQYVAGDYSIADMASF